MKKLLIALLLSSQASIGNAQLSNENEDVISVINSYFNSWNRHDFSDIHGYTTEDMNYVMGAGILWKGRTQVQKGHENAHKALMKKTSFTSDPQSISIRFITPDVAVINLKAKMGAFYPPDGVDRGNNKEGDNRVMLTIVEVKKDGKWLLSSAQGTAINSRAEATFQQ